MKKSILKFVYLLATVACFAQNPIDRMLPPDIDFYNPTINTSNQMTFPNGNTSTSALQNMIDNLSSSGGGVLTISAGTYTFNQIAIKSNVHIRVHPDVIIKSVPQSAIFRAGFTESDGVISNWSFQSTTGEKFKFDLTDLSPNDGIRIFQLSNTTNFKIADFLVEDNNTKFNVITTSATGNNGDLFYPTKGIFENLDVINAHYGYGLVQFQIGRDILFRNISGEGGSTLRLESGLKALADRLDPNAIINGVFGRNVFNRNGATAVMMSPHTITQGWVDVRDIYGESCEAAVEISPGFLSSKKGQTTAGGYAEGTYSNESVIANVTAVYGVNAQVRATRLRYVPCALRANISETKNPDDESYKSAMLAPVYNLALEDLGVPGSYQVVIDNIMHSGFSNEVRADGLITDGGDNDFEGCDISAFVKASDRNTPNPLQTSFTADPLGVKENLVTSDFKIYQDLNSKKLIILSDDSAEIKIYNALGMHIQTIKNQNPKSLIDVSWLPTGLYIINIKTEKTNVSKKIVLN